ncbi:hypothetical protein EVAR_94245_1 [Eumeta japonica]|uniref:Uncharacterized protein n=1 Tax=Eumeta variegata TaxID=151549 RepID=A0A4C1UN26_EUMVA|nr:hypothetical protein EVAR_94245_1 [Eumeta japonica]
MTLRIGSNLFFSGTSRGVGGEPRKKRPTPLHYRLIGSYADAHAHALIKLATFTEGSQAVTGSTVATQCNDKNRPLSQESDALS